MTKRLFQNHSKLRSIRTVLDQCAERTEIHQTNARHQLMQQVQKNETAAWTTPKRSNRLRLQWLVVAACILLAGGILIFAVNQQSDFSSPVQVTAKPVATANSVSPVVEQLVPVSGLVASAPLQQQLLVPPDQGAKLVLPDSSTLWMEGNSHFEFLSKRGDMNMQRGHLLAHFTKRSAPTKIHTAAGTVEIIGTVFSLYVTEQSMTLRLFEGSVAIWVAGIREQVQSGTYLRVENSTQMERRPLDTSDMIFALLSTEKTFHLDGQRVPQLNVPKAEKPSTQLPVRTAHRKSNAPAKKTVPVDERAGSEIVPAQYEIPPTDEMEVHEIDQSETAPAASEISPAEQMLEDACRNLKEGNHTEGKEKIREYLKQHPENRYWDHVHSFFDQ